MPILSSMRLGLTTNVMHTWSLCRVTWPTLDNANEYLEAAKYLDVIRSGLTNLCPSPVVGPPAVQKIPYLEFAQDSVRSHGTAQRVTVQRINCRNQALYHSWPRRGASSIMRQYNFSASSATSGVSLTRNAILRAHSFVEFF